MAPAADTLDRSLAGLRGICDSYLWPTYRVMVPFNGIATGYVPAYSAQVSGLVAVLSLSECETANSLRVHLLQRAHDLITALANGGWVLNDAPRFEFDGDMQRPVVRPGGELDEAPKESGIRLSVDLQVIRVKAKVP